jgi:hypothetical protein
MIAQRTTENVTRALHPSRVRIAREFTVRYPLTAYDHRNVRSIAGRRTRGVVTNVTRRLAVASHT